MPLTSSLATPRAALPRSHRPVRRSLAPFLAATPSQEAAEAVQAGSSKVSDRRGQRFLSPPRFSVFLEIPLRISVICSLASELVVLVFVPGERFRRVLRPLRKKRTTKGQRAAWQRAAGCVLFFASFFSFRFPPSADSPIPRRGKKKLNNNTGSVACSACCSVCCSSSSSSSCAAAAVQTFPVHPEAAPRPA
jgi:hypothetical protein